MSQNDKSAYNPDNTKNKISPSRKQSIITRAIVWLIILGTLVSLFVIAFMPKTSVVALKNWEFNKEKQLTAKVSNSDRQVNIFSDSNTYMYIMSADLVNLHLKTNYGEVDTTGRVRNFDGYTNYVFSNLSINHYKNGEFLILISGVESDTSGVTTVAYYSYGINVQQENDKSFVTDPSDEKKRYEYINAGNYDKFWGSLTNLLQVRPVDRTQSQILSFLVNILPLILLIGLSFYFFRKLSGRVGGDESGESVFTIGRSQAKLAQSKVKFSDVAGIEEEKQELIEIVDYLKKPGKYAAMGARTPRGVILYGPPGTGKTLLAKAVAGEAQVPFFQVTGSAFEDMLVGVGAKRVRDLFNKAKKAAPCIIFIDEIDSVGSKRGKLEISNYSASEQTLNQLLGEMDGFETKSGIIVIAATNRLDVLDEALLRPGRFDRHIKITLPDIKERTAILKIHAKNKNVSTKIDFEDIARRTPGFSGAQLENTLNEAALLAVRGDRTIIILEDIDEAIDRVIAGPAKKSRVMTEQEKKQVAYHEAGHALAGIYLKGGEEVQKITIIPRGDAGGYTLSTPRVQETNLKRKSELLDMIAVALGGRASEEIIYGKDDISTGASNDLYKATNIVRSMVMQLGMSPLGKTQYVPSEGSVNPNSVKLYSDTTATAIDVEINKILDEQYNRVSRVITNNKSELELIVEALLITETILKKDIDYIHQNKKLPEEILSLKNKSKPMIAGEKTEENNDQKKENNLE